MEIKGKTLIVLNTTQEKILAALQSVAGIIDRRVSSPFLGKLIIRGNIRHLIRGSCFANINKPRKSQQLLPSQSAAITTGSKVAPKRASGYFTATKFNLRNAP
ncbi:MAG: hypothetical protein ABL923_12195 [Burkholderiaceae bacterium]